MKKTIISLFALVFIYSFTSSPQNAPNTFRDNRDGKVYKMVTIGEQVWMAENLAYLPSVVGPATGSETVPYYYVYGYNGTNVATAKATTNYQTYGVLYNWPAALEACPDGWHLPSDAEWKQLEMYLGMRQAQADAEVHRGTDEGGKLKETGFSHWEDPNIGATNESGFTALSGGDRDNDGAFSDIGYDGCWWSSTQGYTDTAWCRLLYFLNSHVNRYNFYKEYGFSVRCLRDNNLLSVTTGQVTNITSTTATFSANVASDGGSSITARGICWSTSQNPTTSNSKTTNYTGLGSYTNKITDLSPNTTYYVRAYATNAQGTAYGEQKSFRTSPNPSPSPSQGMVGNTFTDSRDGKVYKTVAIGSQMWMAENLAYLPYVVGPGTGSATEPYYYVYGYDGADVVAAKATFTYATFGVLYNWKAALSACPDGWHLPSDAEWTQLENYLADNGHNYDGTTGGGRDKIAKSLASASGWNSGSGTGTVGNTDYPAYRNKSGFTALPGGYRYYGGTFSSIGSNDNWWSSTESSTNSAWLRYLYYNDSGVSRTRDAKESGFSVRCLRDNNLLSITTGQVKNITTTTATCSGNVTSDGGLSVTAHGVCWSTSQNPTTSNSKTTNGTGLGTYTSNITGLSPNTTYYLRAYATNSQRTTYGEQRTFKTQQEQDPGDGSFTDSRDGNQYKTITIGSQVWMAENLAYLPFVVGPETESGTDPYYYVYGYNGTNVAEAKATANYKAYGVLYNWPAAMEACPDGWHLPSDAEWTQLEEYLIANGYNYDGTTTGNKIAISLASATGWNSSTNAGAIGNTNTAYDAYRNKSGFTALPGGYRGTNGTFLNVGISGHWWSSTQNNELLAWYPYLVYGLGLVYRSVDSGGVGFSVRCVKGNILPMVTTGNVFGVGKNTASCSGNVTAAGGAAVTARGICWSTSQNPTTSNSRTTNGTGLGNYTNKITGLSPNTTYYVRAYATNVQGTAYGVQKAFRTSTSPNPTPTQGIVGNTFTDSRDGKMYKTVTIGSQVWMAENLAYLPYVVGPGTGSEDTDHETDPYYYVYDYYGTNVAEAKATADYQTYGVLYSWYAAKTACPKGWQLPSDNEWGQLETYLANNNHNYDGSPSGDDDRAKIAKSMASATDWNYADKEGAPGNTDYPEYINKSGFSALPGGSRSLSGSFYGGGGFSYWWSSLVSGSNSTLYRSLSYNQSKVNRSFNSLRDNGFSVRCVKSVTLPKVTIGQLTNISTTTATFSANVASDDESSITARGVCWSTSPYPTTSDFKTINGTGSGTYTSNIAGLSPNTTYYVRAYARNAQGTVYGELMKSFRTSPSPNPSPGMVGNTFTDPRDGKVYKTVKIGNQTWMAENLAYLPSVAGPVAESETTPYYYVYDYNGTNVSAAKATNNYNTYGVLYNWPAALTVCPDGWHLPSDAEWTQLENYLIANGYNYDGSTTGNKIGKSLASASGWNSYSETGSVGNTDYPAYRNKSGFTALPGGNRGYDEAFYFGYDVGIGYEGYWWSSTQYDGSNAWLRLLYYSNSFVNRYYDYKDYGFSVRCVRDY